MSGLPAGTDFWSREATDEERDALIERVASEVTRRKLEVPAVLFLEMHKPIANVVMHGAVAFSPFFMPILGADRTERATLIFSKRENVELLIQRIEALRDARDSGAAAC